LKTTENTFSSLTLYGNVGNKLSIQSHGGRIGEEDHAFIAVVVIGLLPLFFR
jgi:hypothetical protein